ncbi:hypothetical protein [Mycolicibacterium sphagni]|uniref:Uncharacterized protein n=1 Tax=Mycolicibacterium sphagni TaxID=1786 RepID=A0A255D9J0_9MYCO|nr:hypothetical protein [Mycolicibacterium sphagni]MCV7174560.1 hypothetical protein [Mycolicibacterium sphagni]OYN76097.1 hypothetical protein CG716_23620 [Mycolicibacterium sphagni]
MSHEKAEWTRRAIDVMTAWSAGHCDSRFAAKRVAAYAGEEPDGAMKLAVGFINLSAMLLTEVEQLSGTDATTILQDIARFTFELSPET